jgi:hypothetical protein
MNSELESVLKSRGGILRIDENASDFPWAYLRAVLLGFENLTTYASNELYTAKKRPIDFCLVDCSALNAFAYASTDREATPFDFIGMNAGAIATILELFKRVFAHPKNFPHIGNAVGEVAPVETVVSTP